MYTAFYGLREKPFNLSPDPRFLFLAESHREALAHLLYGVDQGEGFIAVTGEVGTGKTTLCRSLLERVGSGTDVAFLFNPSRSASELLHSIATEFGLPTADASRSELADRLNRFLLDRKAERRRVLLIVDEAQNLSPGTLEQIRLLSNLETASEKLIQILLLGQPELDAKLDSRGLRQLRQRIGVRWSLAPLSAKETRDYVRHRLRVAASTDREIFTEAALREVHRRTRGVPRLVNLLCDRALLSGYAEKAATVGRAIVRRAAKEIPDTSGRAATLGADASKRLPWLRTTLAAVACAAAVAAGLYFDELRGWLRPGSEAVAVSEESALPSVSSPPPATLRAAADEPLGVGALEPMAGEGEAPGAVLDPPRDAESARLAALNTLLAAFGSEPHIEAPSSNGALLRRVQTEGLDLLRLEDTSLAVLRTLNHPALLVLRGDDGQERLVALVRLDDASGTIHGARESGAVRVPVEEIEQSWSGVAFVVWREHEAMPEVIAAGAEENAVRWLQQSLSELGLFAGTPTGDFDDRTRLGVRTLQRGRRLKPDGAVGPRTKMVLYDMLDGYPVPRLVATEGSG